MAFLTSKYQKYIKTGKDASARSKTILEPKGTLVDYESISIHNNWIIIGLAYKMIMYIPFHFA
jgi:hypothetical protein